MRLGFMSFTDKVLFYYFTTKYNAMISIAPKHTAHEVPDAIYQTYASELRQYVDVRFLISFEDGKTKCVPTWTILKSNSPRWETCRMDETNYSDKIHTALLNRMADDVFGYGNMMAFDFWRNARKYTHDIVGEFISEKLIPQLLTP